MKIFPRPVICASLSVAIVMLVGCSSGSTLNGGSQGEIPQTSTQAGPRLVSLGLSAARDHRQSWINAGALAKVTALTYVSTGTDNTVDIYKGTTQVGSLAGDGGAWGLYVDRVNGDIWVAGNSTILAFHHGQTKPYRTLTDPNEVPNAVAVDTKGTVYVSNYLTSSGQAGSISVYAGGSAIPTSTLSDPNASFGGFIAVDRHGDVYWTTIEFCCPPSIVDEFPAGSSTPKNLALQVTYPQGIEVATNGDLVISDAGTAIDTFPPGATKPSSSIPAANKSYYQIALNKANTDIWGANGQPSFGNNTTFSLDELTYPSGTRVHSISFPASQYPYGVARYPSDPAD